MITPVLMAQEWLSLLQEQVEMSVSSCFLTLSGKTGETTDSHLFIPTLGPAVLDTFTYLFNPIATSVWSHGYPHSTDEETEVQKV